MQKKPQLDPKSLEATRNLVRRIDGNPLVKKALGQALKSLRPRPQDNPPESPSQSLPPNQSPSKR